MSRAAGPAASAALGLGFAAVAFGAKGGSELSRVTPAEIALILIGGLAIAAAVLYGRGPVYGASALAMFAALAGVTALSIDWSIAPDLTWLEANRTLAYLLVFAGALAAARLAPRGAPTLLRGLLLAAALIVGYALAARVWPGSLADNEIYARIGQPFGYWNAVGVTAALALPPVLWLGARRTGRGLANALAFPLTGLLIVALFLTSSRGSLAAAIACALIWILVVPLRLRSLALLAVSAIGAAPVIAWTQSKDAFTEDGVPLSVRESVGPELGLLLLLMIAGLLAVGLVLRFGSGRVVPSIPFRRRLGVVAVAGSAAVVLLLFSSVAFSDRGLRGTVSDRFDELTDETAATSSGAGRLTSGASSRSRYWSQAGKVFDDRPGRGTGAGTFGVARLRYRKDELVSRHAHGYVPQTLADLGLLGLGVTLALALAWAVAAARTTGLRARIPWRRRAAPPREWDEGRVAVTALALAALVFGLQSAIDWTWFVPGPAVMAIAAAGFVAGRGPEPAFAGMGAAFGDAAATLALPPFRTGAPPGRKRRIRAALRLPPWPRILLAAGVIVAVLLCAWAVWQPERADRASDQALQLIEDGRLQAAADEAEDAQDINPVSPQPLFVTAAVENAAGREESALAVLERAVVEHPGDPQAWLRLATYQLNELDRPRSALRTLRGLLYLDPRSPAARRVFEEARAQLSS